MRVFITGGTGLVGSRLVRTLHDRGDQPVVLTRRPDFARREMGPLAEIVAGDPMTPGDWTEELRRCDAVVHLAGEGVFNRRWNADFKETLRKSRVDTTRHVVDALRGEGNDCRILVNASAIGFYGAHGDEELTEDSAAGNDFLARLCIDWEEEARKASGLGVRTTLLRVGVVLDPKGGALAKMLTPFKMFVGGKVGSGRQVVSWIDHEDMVGLILFALDDDRVEGPLNATAPNPVTNKQFAKALGRALHRPSIFPTPGFMLRLALGEVANVVTMGQRVLPRKALDLGYRFRFTEIDAALKELFTPHPQAEAVEAN